MTQQPFIKLSQLTADIQATLQDVFAGRSFWVVADVTNFSYYAAKGYYYFDLVEKEEQSSQMLARIQASAWGTGAARIREFEQVTGQPFKNDIHVLVKVSVDYHPVFGLKLSLQDVDAGFTIGVLEQQKQDTLQRLLKECSDFIQYSGDRYLTTNNQLPLPAVIQHIAVISSDVSAGFQDFMHTLENNPFGYRFRIDTYYTQVQGAANAEQLYNKLLEVYATRKSYDAVVIIRGGGAQTDFLIFDQFMPGKIVAKFPIPIITGIGHQKNETIVDLMAHTPTKTPTKAAEFIIAHNRSFEERMQLLQQQLIIKAQQLCAARIQQLAQLNNTVVNKTRDMLSRSRDGLASLNRITVNAGKNILHKRHTALLNISGQLLGQSRILVSNKQHELTSIRLQLQTQAQQYLKDQRAAVSQHATVIKLMNPANLVKKGFAIISHEGRILSKGEQLKPGDEITVQLPDALLRSIITEKQLVNGK